MLNTLYNKQIHYIAKSIQLFAFKLFSTHSFQLQLQLLWEGFPRIRSVFMGTFDHSYKFLQKA